MCSHQAAQAVDSGEKLVNMGVYFGVALLIFCSLYSLWTVQAGKRSSKAPIKVAAFNIKGFGRAKISDAQIAGHIVDIVGRYDVILIQEVRDSTGMALRVLWEKLNKSDSWGLAVSEPVGRTTYKEQYAFFYRTEAVKVTGRLQYDDTRLDTFEREPFAVEIEYYSVFKAAKNRIVLMALHTKPQDTVQELRLLPQAMKDASRNFKRAKGIIALGDFNADCGYLNNAAKRQMEIFQKAEGFVSLIPDTEDTTVASGTHCAYDRAVVLGKDVTVSDAGPYRFDLELGLDQESALAVSDHYPIQFTLH